MELAAANSALAAIPMFHRNSEDEAQANSLVFTATEGEEQVQGWTSGNLSIEYRAPAAKITEAEMEAISAAIADTFKRASSNIFIDDGRTVEQENTGNLWKRTTRIPIIAKLT